LSLLALYARDDHELEAAISEAKRQRADALVIGADSYFLQASRFIAQNALANALPTMFVQADQARAGGLMSYGHRLAENYVRTAHYVERILKGANPGDLPIEQPTNFQFVVNLRTAKALGVTVPASVLARADEVIQ
jgi:putative tryptophan/tyrosine transport system substrate-binding protein